MKHIDVLMCFFIVSNFTKYINIYIYIKDSLCSSVCILLVFFNGLGHVYYWKFSISM